MKYPNSLCAKILTVAALFGGATSARADVFSEAFNNVGGLGAAGWFFQNNSGPLGTVDGGWTQGNSFQFASQAGAANAYAQANFLSASGPGTISNWMLTPVMSFSNGDTISFFTRTTGDVFPDSLELRLSLNGASTNVGTNPTDVGDFSNILLTINPSLTVGGYPNGWTQFTVTISGLSGVQSGRLGFHYFVTNGGPGAPNGDYIGVDTLQVNLAVPEPSTLALVAFAGLGGITFLARRARRAKL